MGDVPFGEVFYLDGIFGAPCKPFLITYEKRLNWTAGDNETDVTKLLLC